MSTINQFWLIIHVLLGLAGTLWYGAAWLGIERRDIVTGRIHHYTLYGLISFVLSWFTAGLYYTTYYGQYVKPIIIAGKYPWAHQFFTELKEHIFLFLPFIALAVTLIIWSMGDRLDRKPILKSGVAKLTGLVVTLGSMMALMGVVISGAIR